MISSPPTRSRGERSSPAVRTTTAGSSWPAPTPRHPGRNSPQEFLQHVRERLCAQPRGEGGTPLAFSHGFYNTLSCFIQDRFTERLGPSAPLLETMFSRFMEGSDPTEFTLREKATFIAQGVMSGKIFELAKPRERFALERTLETFRAARK